MGASSSLLKPQELTEFRKLNTSIENIEIPTRPENRTVTDKKGFFFFGIPIIIFIAFMVYTLIYSDIRRIYYGYDSCGNMCGQMNPKIDGIPCSGRDYLIERLTYRTPQGKYNKSVCVISCPKNTIKVPLPLSCVKEEELIDQFEPNTRHRHHRQIDDIDFLDDDFKYEKGVSETLMSCKKAWWKFVIQILVTIGLSLVVLCLLRFTPGVLIWGILILSMLVAIGTTIGLWYVYSQHKDKDGEKSVYLLGAVAFTIFTVIVAIILMCLCRKIRLVILLFKEATKAVFAMPFLIFVPVFATILQLIVLISFAITTTLMATSRKLQKYEEDYYEYEMNGVMIFTLVLNLIMTFWTMQFIGGLQYMTIAGSIASWFFAKNKQYLGSPVSTSFWTSIKFHTGSVAFGSFILVLMAIVRAIIKIFCENDRLRCIIDCCCANLEAFLKFLSNNAYIEIAIHGQSFLRSGRRAAKILMSNVKSVIAINSVGDFVLGMIKFLIIVISTGIGVMIFKDIDKYWIPVIICFFINLIIVIIIFGVFTATIDTLFICFCEDKTINDGISRPYFMSRGLMEFVENSKQVYGDN